VRRLAAAVAVGAVGVALAGCSSGGGGGHRAEVAAPAPPARSFDYRVVDVPPAQTHRVAVESHGQAVALVRSSSATWLPEPGTSPMAVSLMAVTEDEILPLQAYRRLDADPNQPDFGLENPELVVRIQNAAAEEQVVSVGGPTFSGAGYYARRSGDRDHVYLLVRRTVDDLRSLLRGVRVDTPRSEQETKIANESEQDVDPEEVSNPWLTQVLQEAQP
jgi:hypothetical protein